MNTKTTALNFEYGIASELDTNQLLTEQDQACFDEIQQVLKKHQALDRFGVTLLDNDALPDNTIRLETNSMAERTLISRIVNKNHSKNKSVETNWTLNNSKVLAACDKSCEAPKGKHGPHHAGGGQAQ
ncbi:hypothetical protein [Microscilla marina]|uniref:Uncharacterized protein n=1 Tax=Microscilla marina ATCC 23134 TaxID=313606 RepID=A1ZPE9_MICM2|nr:hypothetical protein [Microscilla marina]EAY27688.1 hypothetical protein M23134_03756 [Microscilla marina ATCC 23134]